MDPAASLGRDLLAQLPASPDAYPQKLDLVREAVLLVRLDAAAYRAASFLDDRILGPATQGAWLPSADVDGASRRVANRLPVHFIFHTGHVGSTLVSRLLDETGDVLSLREPLPLRTLADIHDALGQVDSLFSGAQFDRRARHGSCGYGAAATTPTRSVVVKATSSAGRLAAPMLSAKRELARNLHESAPRALPRDAAGRTEFADRSARTWSRTHAAAAIARRHGPRPAAHAVDGRAGGNELARGIVDAARQRDAVRRAGDRAGLRGLPVGRGRQHGPDSRPFRVARAIPATLPTWGAALC